MFAYRAISGKNKGHKMLAKMGWKEGQSLGKDEQGIREPVSSRTFPGFTFVSYSNSSHIWKYSHCITENIHLFGNFTINVFFLNRDNEVYFHCLNCWHLSDIFRHLTGVACQSLSWTWRVNILIPIMSFQNGQNTWKPPMKRRKRGKISTIAEE